MLSQEFIRQIDATESKIIVFSVVRNEMLRLPAFLAHYRKMGVSTFAIIDNGSSDGTGAYLANQPGVILSQSTESYAASLFGMHWLNELHQRIRPNTWVLYADADELIVYDDWPRQKITSLLTNVDAASANVIYGFMLDMYPDGPLENAHMAGEDLFAAAPYFDNQYYFRERPVKPWEPKYKALEVIGGPRLRLLSSFKKEVKSTWVDYVLRGQIDRILAISPDQLLPAVVRYWPKQLPVLVKVPLVKSGSGFQYVNGCHTGSGGKPYHRSIVLCHFKFLSDFDQRVRNEVKRGEHYRRGAEYMMYLDAIKKHGSINLRYSGSTRFEGAHQLSEMKFLRNVAGFF